ncbi:ammonium transporter (plasmid) [Azospirillum sp. B510]|uniref:ammonium transporter n=1 Tax=Azospirillum sp. (strain B510) TaxID=137722 RepID=UPI0001C4BC3B|nr:ammonium transporter [Azospirillum sp. B510]BAI74480.1 ammonium transporter [Azospirillum sp. B510]
MGLPRRSALSLGAACAWAATTSTAFAQAAPSVPELSGADTAWMITASMFVLMMFVPGLALFYGGMVRKKNVLSMLMQSFFSAALLTVLWVAAGYSLTFTEGNPVIGGVGKLMLAGIKVDGLSGTIPELVFAMFQCTFAIITPMIIMGGPADRMKFSSAMVFLAIWMLLAYVPVAHMVWGPGGFLMNAGVLDFAGGTVVHINSGVAGLVAAMVVGRRRGAGAEPMAPHNLVLTMIGGSLLWVGWFGFNAGSALTAGPLAGLALINTQIAAAATVSWVAAEWMVKGRPSLLGAVSGAIAGLVVITPACGFVSPGSAMIMGLAGGVVCYWGATGLKKLMGVDDALDVFGVHGVGGILGAVLTGVFASAAYGGEGKSGWLDGNFAQVGLQIEGVVVTVLWTAVVTVVALKAIDIVMGLRVDQDVEVDGLDLALHGETMHS